MTDYTGIWQKVSSEAESVFCKQKFAAQGGKGQGTFLTVDSRHAYSEAGPTVFNGSSSHKSAYRIGTLQVIKMKLIQYFQNDKKGTH